MNKKTLNKPRRNKVLTGRRTNLTDPLYTYVSPKLGSWVRTQAVRSNVSYSEFINNMIRFAQTEGFRIKKTTTRATRAA